MKKRLTREVDPDISQEDLESTMTEAKNCENELTTGKPHRKHIYIYI